MTRLFSALFPAAALLATTSLSAAPVDQAAPGTPSVPRADPQALRQTVEKLVSFGTRHTLSSATDPKRGIGAARNWAQSQFDAIARSCGGCMKAQQIHGQFSGPRAPNGADVGDVIAIQPGRMGFDHVIIVSGHIDSRVTDVMNITDDAPGANDDGSGSALVLEAARLLAGKKFDATIVYALVAGEEQGLWGSELLARTAEERHWHVSAMLNNDIVGNTVGLNGERVDDRVRVFSEGISAAADEQAVAKMRAEGGEDDSPSRALAKAVSRIAEDIPGHLETMLVRRPDRFGRAGDQLPFQKRGYPAIRFTVGAENYDYQHQDLRTENGKRYGDTIDQMDFPYLAKVTDINVATIATLAAAPPQPARAWITGALSDDTTIHWDAVSSATSYRVFWRRADGHAWTDHRDVKGATTLSLKDVVIDDNFFGVAALSGSGAQSIITFAGLPPKGSGE